MKWIVVHEIRETTQPSDVSTEEGGGAEVIINCFTGYINCLKYSPNFFLAQNFFSCLSTFYITSDYIYEAFLFFFGFFIKSQNSEFN